MKLENAAAQRVQPRLRMVYNGDDVVNARRAAYASALCRTSDEAFVEPPDERALPGWERPARGVRVSAFIELSCAEHRLDDLHLTNCRRHGKLATADLTLDELQQLTRESDPGTEGSKEQLEVAYVSAGEVLEPPNPTSRALFAEAPPARDLASGMQAGAVLIGIIDVGGFDFAHPDFLRAGATRFEQIWDQGLSAEPGSDVPYGRVITREQIDQALAWQDSDDGLAATLLLPQSAQQPGSHATHVASIAGGDCGVCPQALLAGVTIAIPADEQQRSRTFFDSTRLAHAVDHLEALARRLGKPLVINISLGTNGHAHDGSSPISRWIERVLDESGRCVVVAAGNAGQEAPRFEGDLGFLSGRIHAAGRIEATGLEVDLEWEVLGGDAHDLSENEMEIWYEPQDDFEVDLKPPGESRWIGAVSAGHFLQNHLLANGTVVSMYNERYHPANGANRISVFLSPRLRQPIAGVKAGTWTVRLRGRTVRDGRFHAWIERDDARPVSALGERRAAGEAGWGFPSLFSRASNVDLSSVNSLGCSERVVTVANYDASREKIHASSSQGPTRDGRCKPEIATVGADVLAANGFGRPGHPYISKTGTSMASPYVAGVAATMLALEPRLNASQIIGIMRRTAQPLPGDDYGWHNDAGFGRLQPLRCLEEVRKAFSELESEQPAAGQDGPS